MFETRDFFSLDRCTQDRLVAILRREARPAYLAKRAFPVRSHHAFAGSVGALVLVLGVALVLFGLGDARSIGFHHPPTALAVYVLLLTALGAGLVVVRRKARSKRALPLPVGRYLLATGVLEVRPEVLRFAPFTSYEVAGCQVTCAAGGQSFQFALAPTEAAAATRELARAAKADSPSTDASPFAIPRFRSPVAPMDPYRFSRTNPERYPVAVALAWSVPCACLLFLGRDLATDGLAYRAALRTDDVHAYEVYARRGKAFVAVVRERHLPRAALRDAKAEGTVAAVERFRAAFPATQIEPEIAAARNLAVLSELAQAVKAGKLSALREHAVRFPNEAKAERSAAVAAHVGRERERALHRSAAGQRELSGLRAAIVGLHSVPTVDGTSITVETSGGEAPGLAEGERAVRKTITWNGRKSLPSALLTKVDLGSRASASADLARFALAPLLETDAVAFCIGDAHCRGPRARLFVARNVDWSGRVFTSLNPRVSVAGLNVAYEVLLVLPSGERVWSWKTSVSMGVHVAQIKKDTASPLEERLYREMQDAADHAFGVRLKAALEKKGAQAAMLRQGRPRPAVEGPVTE